MQARTSRSWQFIIGMSILKGQLSTRKCKMAKSFSLRIPSAEAHGLGTINGPDYIVH